MITDPPDSYTTNSISPLVSIEARRRGSARMGVRALSDEEAAVAVLLEAFGGLSDEQLGFVLYTGVATMAARSGVSFGDVLDALRAVHHG